MNKQHKHKATSYRGAAAIGQFAIFLQSFGQGDATGNAYGVIRNEDRHLVMRPLSNDEISSFASEASEAHINNFEMIVIDSGNTAGDSWKATLHPKEELLTYVDENVDVVHAPISQDVDTVLNLAKKLHWTSVELRHARQFAQDQYGEECIVVLANGRALHTPAFNQDCDYVRIVQAGHELAYWHSDEWRIDPLVAMGAILGCAHGPLMPEVTDETDASAQETPIAVVEMDGGKIHMVRSNVPMRVILLDRDTEGADEDRIKNVNTENVFVHNFDLPKDGTDEWVDADFVAHVVNQIKEE